MDTTCLMVKALAVAFQHRGTKPDAPIVRGFAERQGVPVADIQALAVPEDQKPDHFTCWRCNGAYTVILSATATLCDCDNGIMWNDGLTEYERADLPKRQEAINALRQKRTYERI